ncbi:hypothetical protein MBLNU230_g5419t1 [Neophaeotheca triangularis]
MRVSQVLLLAAAAPAALAAPTPGVVSNIVSTVQGLVGKLTNNTPPGQLKKALKALGLTLPNNANKHGNPFSYLDLVVAKKDGAKGNKKHNIPGQAKKKSFVDWKTFKSNGVGLGAWLEQEQNYDVAWWAENVGPFPDEWSWCETVGFEVCGPKLEERFASFITTDDVDKMGQLGINTLRIPTTYAAWAEIPGSWLYHGNQRQILKKITDYAIDKYGMHIILSLHGLPGGINTLPIGEALGRNFWFQNVTNLEYSYTVFDSLLDFVATSGKRESFTLCPGNEFSDNFAGFATPSGLTEAGTNWINMWINGCLDRIAKVDKRIPIMLQDSFFSERYWSPFYPAGTNLVIDSHIYFFAAAGAYQQYVAPAACGQADYIGRGDGKFPVFIGEWSLQSNFNNTLAGRKTLYDTQAYAYQTYASGSSFWNYKMLNTVDGVDGAPGEAAGTLQDYWSWEVLADDGVVTKGIQESYC